MVRCFARYQPTNKIEKQQKKKANVERDRFMRYRRIKIYIHIGLELNEIYVVLFCIQIVWAARPELKAN